VQEKQTQADLLPPGRQIGTKSDYARHRGCAPSAITRAIKDGRIPVLMINGRAMLDFAACDHAWAVSTRPRFDSPGPSAPRGPRLEAEPGADLDALAAARLLREQAAGQLLALRVDREAGLLLERSAVERVVADAGAALRTALADVPHRIGPDLVGRSLPEIAGELGAELERVLRDFCRRLDGFADGTDEHGLGVLDLINPDPGDAP